ncbi:helix-turn-helix transcriptional regulator [Sulfitobacter sp. R18_1]|uniref:helix-turn-helix transcriptional regulator n=1 Tax=Sulfitobacter sp. R18_1 TaxID=2821104 RepID=UPI001FFE14C1|nr:helix-turn-helix transcriptional regulator [Sulfitobacter sp. R18_1]
MTRLLVDQKNDDSTVVVAERLKAIRTVTGLNKKGFAERAGITEQTYGPFENSKRELSLLAAKKLRKTYDLSLDFLYFGVISDLPSRYIESYLKTEITDDP